MELGQTKIAVAVRMRPRLSHEPASESPKISVNTDEQHVLVRQDYKVSKKFVFDVVFDQRADQEQTFQEWRVPEMIQKVSQGFNATIFAYGQTGSGKTYTMEGYEYATSKGSDPKPIIIDDPTRYGIVQRSIRSLFNQLNRGQNDYFVQINFMQLYNEKIFDLLNPTTLNSAGLKLRWSKYAQFYVENLTSVRVASYEELMHYYNTGIRNRVMASTNMNMASSRSHAILTLTVEVIDSDGAATRSKLQLVDLAGSERSSQTGAEGLALKESIDINKALFTLRQVISVLSNMRERGGNVNDHVPYRDSKLTSILKQSIGGNSYCLMIACIAPTDIFYDENISTLTYATKTTTISNDPIKNIDPKSKVLKRMQTEINKLTDELKNAYRHIDIISEPQQEMARPSTVQMPKFNSNVLSPEVLSEKLQDSVKMLREAMVQNQDLRKTVDDMENLNNMMKSENSQLQVENDELRDRNEVLEQIDTSNLENEQSYEAQLSDLKKATAIEIMNLQREKAEMAKRIQQLEMEQTSISRQISNKTPEKERESSSRPQSQKQKRQQRSVASSIDTAAFRPPQMDFSCQFGSPEKPPKAKKAAPKAFRQAPSEYSLEPLESLDQPQMMSLQNLEIDSQDTYEQDPRSSLPPSSFPTPNPPVRGRNQSAKGPRFPNAAPISPIRSSSNMMNKRKTKQPHSTRHEPVGWKSKRTEVRPGTANRSNSTNRNFQHYDKPNDHMLNFRGAVMRTVERSYKSVNTEANFDPFAGYSRLLSEKSHKTNL